MCQRILFLYLRNPSTTGGAKERSLKSRRKNTLTHFTARIASLALVALPLATFGAAAHAQPSVRIADLDLASATGKAAFAHRVNVAASQICRDERDLSIQHACKIAVRTEVTEKLAMIRPTTQLAAVR